MASTTRVQHDRSLAVAALLDPVAAPRMLIASQQQIHEMPAERIMHVSGTVGNAQERTAKRR
jgi:hypothetical protein